jgi:hypothetical protein
VFDEEMAFYIRSYNPLNADWLRISEKGCFKETSLKSRSFCRSDSDLIACHP